MSIILGAGLSGLIAATQFPNSTIIEANGQDALSHRAVLRFRTDVLSRLTGIPFRKVTVRKNLWCFGQHMEPDVQLANWYSRKTNGAYLDRSIWNLEPVERYIAPEDLTQQMIGMISNRVKWHTRVDRVMLMDLPRPIISTAPMPVLVEMVGAQPPCDFGYSGVKVDRYRISGADVFQTIYFPDPNFPVYRASITGDLLIVERIGDVTASVMDEVLCAFGVHPNDTREIEVGHAQRFGKIKPINDAWRRQFIFEMTQQHGIYSLGRFAIWKNVLLDDVAHDTAVIKRLVAQGSYGAVLQHSRTTSH